MYDDKIGYAVNLKEMEKITIEIDDKGMNEFKLLVGTMDYILFKTNGIIGAPTVFRLGKNYPNPFNPATTIRYQIPKAGKVMIDIYNIRGKKVKTLINKRQRPGYYKISWDGKGNNNKEISSGVYFYRMSAGNAAFVKIRRMVVVK